MRTNAFIKPKFYAEYWDYITNIDITGERRDEYFKVGELMLYLTTAGEGVVSVWSPAELRRNASLRNLRDSLGNLVFADLAGNSIDAYVGNGEPHFNIFGQVEGYRYNVTKGV